MDGFSVLHPDVISLILSFLDVPLALGRCCVCGASSLLSQLARTHEHWRCHVLQQYGVYYDDYMQSISVASPEKWRLLHLYVKQVHTNVDKKCVHRRVFHNVLKPTIRIGSRQYRGSLELADNCKVFFWETGRYVQILDVQTGATIRIIDTGQTFRRYFHRVANVKEKLFVCLNDKIVCYNIEKEDEPRVELPMDKVERGRPLELLVHRTRLVLLLSTHCAMWDTRTFEFVCNIRHHAIRHHEHAGSVLEVQWMGSAIITWLRNSVTPLRVWNIDDGLMMTELDNLDGKRNPPIELDVGNEWVQVDVARVTWDSICMLDHFILAALDKKSVVTLWDSKQDFKPIFRFNCGCRDPFDLVLTQDFLAVINDDGSSNKLNLTFWRLWLHPDFKETSPRSSSPSDTESIPTASLGKTASNASEATDAIRRCSVEVPCEFDIEKLYPVAKKIKQMDLSEVDSYFASHRNFLNVCSFHKSGLESLSVYKSKILKKKIFFPPAKVTKFEEWIAIQMALDGSVTLYDFRPNSTSFDDLVEKRVRNMPLLTINHGSQPAWRQSRNSKSSRRHDASSKG
eukprot:GEMP01003332.1.p1 GENE.GEMP01003332.1~~GEMP01003332.1.p1  ORF type:complete len:569 (+),score=75.12 GEMP01003332.1:173-1879(+)